MDAIAKEVSCIDCMNAIFHCYGASHQFDRYYKDGTFDTCERQQLDWKLCWRLKAASTTAEKKVRADSGAGRCTQARDHFRALGRLVANVGRVCCTPRSLVQALLVTLLQDGASTTEHVIWEPRKEAAARVVAAPMSAAEPAAKVAAASSSSAQNDAPR